MGCTIPVPDFVAEVLAARLELATDIEDPGQLLFHSRNGTPMQAGNLRRAWREIREMSDELGFVIPHALRRRVVTVLAEKNPAYAAAFLGGGHSIATLDKHYVVETNQVDQDGAGILDSLAPTGKRSPNHEAAHSTRHP